MHGGLLKRLLLLLLLISVRVSFLSSSISSSAMTSLCHVEKKREKKNEYGGMKELGVLTVSTFKNECCYRSNISFHLNIDSMRWVKAKARLICRTGITFEE